MNHHYQLLSRASGLDAPDTFWRAEEADIARQYNGCGPEHFSRLQDAIVEALTDAADPDAELRAILTDMLALFELGFVIHDWDFAHSDRTEAGFITANHRLYVNMGKLLNEKYPIWRAWQWPARSEWWLKMRLVYKAVSGPEGLRAWKEAAK